MTVWESLKLKINWYAHSKHFLSILMVSPPKMLILKKTPRNKWLQLGTDFLRRAGEDRRREGEC